MLKYESTVYLGCYVLIYIGLLNSHGRHVNVYFTAYPTLVLAFRVAEVDCKMQLAACPSGRQLAVDKGVKIAADFYKVKVLLGYIPN